MCGLTALAVMGLGQVHYRKSSAGLSRRKSWQPPAALPTRPGCRQCCPPVETPGNGHRAAGRLRVQHSCRSGHSVPQSRRTLTPPPTPVQPDCPAPSAALTKILTCQRQFGVPCEVWRGKVRHMLSTPSNKLVRPRSNTTCLRIIAWQWGQKQCYDVKSYGPLPAPEGSSRSECPRQNTCSGPALLNCCGPHQRLGPLLIAALPAQRWRLRL